MEYAGMTYIVMAHIVVAYVANAHVVVAYVVVAHTVPFQVSTDAYMSIYMHVYPHGHKTDPFACQYANVDAFIHASTRVRMFRHARTHARTQ